MVTCVQKWTCVTVPMGPVPLNIELKPPQIKKRGEEKAKVSLYVSHYISEWGRHVMYPVWELFLKNKLNKNTVVFRKIFLTN